MVLHTREITNYGFWTVEPFHVQSVIRFGEYNDLERHIRNMVINRGTTSVTLDGQIVWRPELIYELIMASPDFSHIRINAELQNLDEVVKIIGQALWYRVFSCELFNVSLSSITGRHLYMPVFNEPIIRAIRLHPELAKPVYYYAFKILCSPRSGSGRGCLYTEAHVQTWPFVQRARADGHPTMQDVCWYWLFDPRRPRPTTVYREIK